MAVGDRVRTSWQVQHEILEAANERGWLVTRIDMRAFSVTLEEPVGSGVVLVLTGRLLDAPFIRTLPEARQPAPHGEAAAAAQEPEATFSRADPNRETLHRGGERS